MFDKEINGEQAAQIGEAVSNLNPDDDAHWTKSGLPDLNVLSEAVGFRVSRKNLEDLDPALTRETEKLRRAEMASDNEAPDEDDPFVLMDRVRKSADSEFRRLHPEFGQALQAYEAQLPTIEERRRRVQARANRKS